MRKRFIAVFAATLIAGAGCDSAVPAPTDVALEAEAHMARSAGPNVVNVTTEHLDLDFSRTEIAAGWTTFRYKNRSHHTHFFVIEKLPLFDKDGDGTPEQMTQEDWIEDLAQPFQNLMDWMIGRAPSFPGASFGAWGVEYKGGPGLTAAGQTSTSTVWLDPGRYLVECYVKDEDGTFHVVDGMVAEFVVGEKMNHAGPPPNPSVRLTLSVADGIEVEGSIDRPGMHTVEVHFEDQSPYANFVQHDVHLVRLEDGTELERVASWMDWRIVPGDPYYGAYGGLATPAPATFLGGAQEAGPGSTTYFSAHLEKGDYAWIAELPADVLLESGAPHWIVPFTID